MTLTADDLAPLDIKQKEAVLTALYVALIADGPPKPAELAKFTETFEGLPWGQPMEVLQVKMRRDVLTRLTSATREGKIAFLQETVPNIPVALRERVMHAMVVIAEADGALTQGEQNSLSAFAHAFDLTAAQVASLRSKFA